MASTTVSTVIARAAQEIGRYLSSTVTTQAIGPDPARWLISTAFEHDGGTPSWEDAFVQLTATGAVRRVIHEEPSLGAIALDQVLSATQIVTAAFTVSWPSPLADTQGFPGLLTFVAQGCRDLSYPDTLTINTTGAYTYSMAAYQEWLCEERVTGFLDPAIGTYPALPAPWRYDRLLYVAGVPILQLKRAYLGGGGEYAGLEVIRPAYTLVNGIESTTGPTVSTDVVAADQDDLVAVTKLRAFRWLATAAHLTDAQRSDFAAKAVSQDAWVRANVRHYLPRDEMPRGQGAVA